ncbi:hypothetical protein H9P43_009383 [Blastocladiella emersonii ATCC 22665]|nr:hypothetical protein H9P43_009383 [Blastocladiella emersonii ATCC 22665]
MWRHLALRSAVLPRRAATLAARRYTSATPDTSPTPDGVVVGCYEGETPSLELFSATAFAINDRTNNALFGQLERSGFRGKLGEARVFYPPAPEDDGPSAPVVPPRVAVVGLGKRPEGEVNEGVAWERARKVSAIGVKALQDVGARRIGVEAFANCPRSVAEGAALALYKFDHLKTKPKPKKSADPATTTTPPTSTPVDISVLSRTGDVCDALNAIPAAGAVPSPTDLSTGRVLAQSQNLARYLMETPANLMTPRLFAETALNEFKDLGGVTVKVHDEAWVLARGMHAFHAVAKGSAEPLQYLEIHYRGRELAGAQGKVVEESSETAVSNKESVCDVALVGKGVTFDSGGISIKPSAGMGLMRGDMGGAATVLASLHGIARLRLPINIVALIPLCENMPSSSSVKPGDVVRASNGLTIEIDNTDAEGRLLLADALYHATSFQPAAVIDVATLTGAMDVALGRVYTGVFASHHHLWAHVARAAEKSGDKAWRMPLDPAYLAQMQSSVADLKNAGDRSAGACTAAIFLHQFLRPAVPAAKALAAEVSAEGEILGAVPYVHIDMAGVMHYARAADGYNTAGMSGRPTRMLIEMVRSMAKV